MRILFLTARPPWPGRRGDQARIAGFVRHLAARHEIRVLAQRGADFPPTPRGSEGPPEGVEVETVAIGRVDPALALARGLPGFLAGRRPLQATLFDHSRFHRAAARLVAHFAPDAVVVVLSRLADVLPALERGPGDVPVVLDLVDALALNMRRRADRDALVGALWRAEARRLARWDARAIARTARATVVAERDRRALVEGAPEALRATVEERLRVVPFGLDLPENRPESTDRAEPAGSEDAASEYTVALTGNLGYFPTVDGARFFAERVWPILRARRPDARWLLAGARPAPAIRRLAERPGVELVADPDDLRALVRRAAVSVAPLRAGSGTPIKILEAMADGVPVVTTPGGVAGLDDLPEGAVAVAVADDPEIFAQAVLRLLDDPVSAREQSERARAWLDRHRLERSASAFESILEEAAARHRLAKSRGQIPDAETPPSRRFESPPDADEGGAGGA